MADFVLVRFPDRLEELIHCSTRFQLSIAIVERELLERGEHKPGELLRMSGSLRVLARVDGGESEHTLERLLILGCHGFVDDRISTASLQRVLRGVSAGEIAAGRKLLSRALQRLLLGTAAPKLSRREQEVVELLALGLSNKRIAERLFISEETLRWHLRNLYGKTELKSRAELVEYASAMPAVQRPEVLRVRAAGEVDGD